MVERLESACDGDGVMLRGLLEEYSPRHGRVPGEDSNRLTIPSIELPSNCDVHSSRTYLADSRVIRRRPWEYSTSKGY
jgi:hypothetical protein